jgi:hypothetical protein
LPLLLWEWARVDLRRYFAGLPRPTLAAQRKRLKKVANRAAALIQALDELEGFDRWALVEQLGTAEGLGVLTAHLDEQYKRRVDEWHILTATIATALTKPSWKPSKGQPRNDIAQLVLRDLAALFGYITGRRARRNVDRCTHEESGHFLNFARAVWPVVFGKGDSGLPTQFKKWAANGSKSSAIVAHIAKQHSEWGVITAP